MRMEGIIAKEAAGLVALQAVRPGQLADELRFWRGAGEIPARGGWTVTGGGSAVRCRASARRFRWKTARGIMDMLGGARRCGLQSRDRLDCANVWVWRSAVALDRGARGVVHVACRLVGECGPRRRHV